MRIQTGHSGLLLFILVTSVFLDGGAAGPARSFLVRDYGARGDGVTLDSPALQKAIDACAAAGGGTVEFSRGTYLSRPLFLRGDNLRLLLDAGAVLQGTTNYDDYRTGDNQVVGLISADKLKNVSIFGPGIIDGAGAAWWPAARAAKNADAPEPRRRPKMISFHDCTGVTVSHVTLRNSPSFHLVPVDCADVLIDHVTIKAPGNSPNTDAIDPSACRHVMIRDCLLDVGDDNVAVKAGHPVAGRDFSCEDITVSNCACLFGHGISIGSETSGGVSGFTVVHCTFDGTTSGIRIKTTRAKGGRVDNILYKDLTMNNVRRPIDIACYYPKVPPSDAAQPITALTPFYRDIRIENLTGNGPDVAGLIVGLPESPVRSLVLSGVHLKCATGLWIKNADNVELNDVKIEPARGEPIILDHATVHQP